MVKTERRQRRTFTNEFKNQIVQIYLKGIRKSDIIHKYDLTSVTLDSWIKRAESTGSFKEKDNRWHEKPELAQLRNEIQQLKMDNSVLKQAMMIMAQK